MGRYELENVYFINVEHKQRLLELMLKDNTISEDIERLSLFYIMASNMDLCNKFKNNLYDFNEHWINPKGLSKIDLSSSQRKLVNLAFNLYNNYHDEEEKLTILNTFSGLDPDNFRMAIEGIKLRVGQ